MKMNKAKFPVDDDILVTCNIYGCGRNQYGRYEKEVFCCVISKDIGKGFRCY